MKKIFTISNLIPLLLIVHIGKGFVVGPSFYDFGIIALMSLSLLYKLYLDKDSFTDKEELKTIIAQLKEEVNKKMTAIEEIQNSDRLVYESKFSTLNLGIQHQKRQPSQSQSFGWGANTPKGS